MVQDHRVLGRPFGALADSQLVTGGPLEIPAAILALPKQRTPPSAASTASAARPKTIDGPTWGSQY